MPMAAPTTQDSWQERLGTCERTGAQGLADVALDDRVEGDLAQRVGTARHEHADHRRGEPEQQRGDQAGRGCDPSAQHHEPFGVAEVNPGTDDVADGVADTQARADRGQLAAAWTPCDSLWIQNARNSVRNPVAQRNTHSLDSAVTTEGAVAAARQLRSRR
jgi:hypothetical protein